MYDVFMRMRPHFAPEASCAKYGLTPEKFVVATLHRDFNVDMPAKLVGMLWGLARFQDESGFRVLLPLHPRTRKRVSEFFLSDIASTVSYVEPLGYAELMSLVSASPLVVTDSGGLQKEAYCAGRRSVVVMPDTGWRELTDCGWNILCEPVASELNVACHEALRPMPYSRAIYGEGDTALRIIRMTKAWLDDMR